MDKALAIKELEYLIEFTYVYRSEPDKYIREAKCLKMQIPKILVPMSKQDLVVGRMKHGFVGFSPQYGGLYTYYFHHKLVAEAMKVTKDILNDETMNKVKECFDFWQKEKTVKKLQKNFCEKHSDIEVEYKSFGSKIGEDGTVHLPGEAIEVERTVGIASIPTARIALTIPDTDKLIRLGLPGLRQEIQKYKKQNKQSTFYQALDMVINTVADAAEIYKGQALEFAKQSTGKNQEDLLETAKTLENIQTKAPKCFKEGLQLYWLYAVISDQMNTGRMDVFLGDLYTHDLNMGKIDEEEAIRYLTSLYSHYSFIDKIHDTRIIIGGKGRRNEEQADKLAMTILETSRRVKEVIPQLTLRYYRGMNEAILNKAFAVLEEGTSFPLLYSDETNIPAVMKAYGVSEKEAESYIPAGCGEYVLEAYSTGTPNCGFNLLKAVELVLHNGDDAYHKKQAGLRTGEIETLDTFEKFWKAYEAQVEPEMLREAWAEAECYNVAGENAGFLHLSLLMNDCIARNKAMLEGGVRYLNGAPEIIGMISAADSLVAIKKIVYEEKIFTLKEVVTMLDANFEGYEKERQVFLDAPKYGNNDSVADEMVQKVFNHIATETIKCTEIVGLDAYRMVSVNNSASADWGEYTMASACGRKDGDPLANANSASIGADKSGITALLHSMSKYDNTLHSGVINSVRISKELLKNSYHKIRTLVTTFFENNGTQLNLMVIGKDDLENAMKHPEQYKNLIVRIGGFSAKFVELNPIVQNEIIKRTTFDN